MSEPGANDTRRALDDPGTGAVPDDASPTPADLPGEVPVDLTAVRSALLEWYDTHQRSFPWRETTDPYEILVSEVMSQQTQLGRVVDAWAAFLDRWPTIETLAAADRADVVGFWSAHSLGYNNRARYLHEAAGEVVGERGGTLPRSPDELSELMGVGPYTANAVASFAFNNGNAVVDTNVRRVLYRAYDVPDDESAFDRVAQALLPAGESRQWNNAMMELGGVVCEQTPRCESGPCPWREWCSAYATGDFTAPDVPEQPSFEGSRRQMRGRIVAALEADGELTLDELGHRIRVDYAPDGEHGREWLRDLLADLTEDGLVAVDADGEITARLRR